MRKINVPPPNMREILGATIGNYPEGFMWPYTVLIRQTWHDHRAKLEKEPIEFTIPGYGVLTMHGRTYKFEPNKGYAAQKGYPDLMEGEW